MKLTKIALFTIIFATNIPLAGANGANRAYLKGLFLLAASKIAQLRAKRTPAPVAPLTRPVYSLSHSFRNDFYGAYNGLKTTGNAIAYILTKMGPEHPLYRKFTFLLAKYAPWWVGGSLATVVAFLLYKSVYGPPAPANNPQTDFMGYREDYQILNKSLFTALICVYMVYKAVDYPAFLAKYKRPIIKA